MAGAGTGWSLGSHPTHTIHGLTHLMQPVDAEPALVTAPQVGFQQNSPGRLLEKQGNKVTLLSQAAEMRMTQPSWFLGA